MLGVASSRRDARIPARTHILARICAMKQSRTKSLATNIRTIPKNMPTNFQLERLKLNLDIVKKPENRVHKLTDSNVSRADTRQNVRARRNSRISARARKRRRAKSLATNIGTIPKNMSTNFQLKRLKLNLDIVEKPENRVHKLTDSNVSLGVRVRV